VWTAAARLQISSGGTPSLNAAPMARLGGSGGDELATKLRHLIIGKPGGPCSSTQGFSDTELPRRNNSESISM
jgi:hypothetical protein